MWIFLSLTFLISIISGDISHSSFKLYHSGIPGSPIMQVNGKSKVLFCILYWISETRGPSQSQTDLIDLAIGLNGSIRICNLRTSCIYNLRIQPKNRHKISCTNTKFHNYGQSVQLFQCTHQEASFQCFCKVDQNLRYQTAHFLQGRISSQLRWLTQGWHAV